MMKQLLFRLLFTLLVPTTVFAQQKIDRLIVITTDGFRWQEVFNGMDSGIAVQPDFNQGDSVRLFKNYWHADGTERRRLLLPFFWNTLARQGQVYGNRDHNNYVNVANKYWFS